ncbi:hypothetical protein [Nocardia camponoti]|uniref:Uncharacterized protein n=1 Tax=Nocardia camponoti TaxID=1616106 RepID=A0A917QDD8_9NOCA|nr:hypothetical protein [Nocardia camponoti]GGK44795.1 hypothetical protein GCM10011591_15490 [Nocardia camponoti]
MPKTYFGGTSYSPHRPFHNRPGNPARATIAEQVRAANAVGLYLHGATYQEVADRLGYAHRASAYNVIMRFIVRHQALSRSWRQRRQAEAVMLRLDSWTWQEIADELGYRTRSGAYRAAFAAVDRAANRLSVSDRVDSMNASIIPATDRDF